LLGLRQGGFICVGWQVTPHSSVIGLPELIFELCVCLCYHCSYYYYYYYYNYTVSVQARPGREGVIWA